tara:strand:- start:2652 stop:3983 length:1332 start_codon:yes stop_codon:yes gene_type:complete
MSELYQAGQIEITKAEIESPGGDSVDINTGVLKAFEICEDIFSNHLTATIALQDGYGIISKHNVLGCGDKLTLSFKTPGMKEISVELYSYYMTPRYQVDTRIDAYEINFISKEAFINQYKRISKYYKGTTTDIIQEIASEELEMDLTLDVSSDEEIEFIIPNWNPLQAIQWLMARTINSDNAWDNNLVLYQDLEMKYKLTSIGKLMEGSNVFGSPEKGYRHARVDASIEEEEKLKTALKWNNKQVNHLEQIQQGHDYNATLTHDWTRKYFTVTEYKAKDHFDKATKLLDERPRKEAESGDNPYKDIYDEQPTVYRYCPKSQYLFDLEEDKSGQDKVGKDDSPEDGYDWVASKVHQNWRTRSVNCMIETPGWSERKAGEIVSMTREDHGKETENDSKRKITDDKLSYGDFLAVSVKHKYFSGTGMHHGSGYTTVTEGLRDSLKG